MDEFNTGWDPYEELLQHRGNIQQCAMAINHGTEVMKELANKFNHQQEVIQQLQFNDRKLQQLIDALRHQVVQQGAQLEMFKMQNNQ